MADMRHRLWYTVMIFVTYSVREQIPVSSMSDSQVRYDLAYEAWHVYDSTFCVKIYENKLTIHDWHWSVWRTTLAVNWLILLEWDSKSAPLKCTFERFGLDNELLLGMNRNLWSPPGNRSNYCMLDFWHWLLRVFYELEQRLKTYLVIFEYLKTSNLECIIMLFTVSSHLAEIKIFRVRRNPVWLFYDNGQEH